MDEQKERAAFEAWAPTYHKLTNPGPLTRLDGNGRYFYGPVNASWAAWKARAALAATPAPEPDTEQLRLAGLTLIGLAEHDQHCDVFDLDDEGKHKTCSCGFDGSIAVITQAGKMAATPAPAPLTDEQIDAGIAAWFKTEISTNGGKDRGHPFRQRMRAAIDAARAQAQKG